MASKILITGPPRCGKSTLILKLIDYYFKKDYIVCGFSTPEIRKQSRIGFDIEDISSKQRFPLARAGNYKSRFRLGKYFVFIDEFNKYLDEYLQLEKICPDIIIIDEIGKMELFSEKFQKLIRNLFRSSTQIIATIGEKMRHPIKSYILTLAEVKLFNLTRQNQQKIFQEIISLIP
ncbi:MAG: NTPase [Promethearchaeota archaeon]